MTPERWQRVEKLVQDSLGRDAQQRAALLDAACRGDRTLRAEVESLLEAYEGAGSFMENPTFGAELESIASHHDGSRTGQRIGPYTILREIGHGGMSTVFLAARADREYERRVAIKLIRRGTESEPLRHRFRRERQILASLEHPNIARLHDGGTTRSGLPYLVMEYLEGIAIDAYCDQRRLSVAQRLELFRNVCSAVQYAHRNLVIHRDIKPSNILVTGDGVPKLLDFGIAKLLDPEGFPQTIEATRTAVRPMTPSYASPEQVRSGAITTATDVYSLGVLLYKLLTGRLPYRLEDRTPQTLEDAILRAPPLKPSAAILQPRDDATPESIAAQRGTSPRHLRRQLEGDLDTIVLMALRKDPRRRYGSVEQLSEDVRRHLEGLPVVARADTVGYRVRKFVRRNRLAVALASGFMVMVLGFAVAMALLAAQLASERDRNRSERDRAELERSKAEQVTTFFTDLFRLADPSAAAGNSVTVREVLDLGSHRIGEELAGQPEVQAAVLHAIGEVYHNLGLYEEAVPLFESALESRRESLGPSHPSVAETLSSLASSLKEKGDFEVARSAERESLAIRQTTLGDDALEVAESLGHLAWFERFEGHYADAERLMRRALAIRRTALGNDHPEIAAALYELAEVLWDRREAAAAEDLYREALGMARKHLGDDHPDVLTYTRSLTLPLQRKGDLETAARLTRGILATERRIYDSPDHPQIASTINYLASILHDQGEYDEAEKLYRESLEMRRKVFGEDHPVVAVNLGNLAYLLSERGDYAAAAKLQRESLGIGRQNLPAGSPHLAFPLLGLGGALVDLGEPEEAEPLLREALTIRREALPGGGGYLVAEAERELGRCLTGLGDFAEAEALLLSSYPVLMLQAGAQPNRTRRMTLRYLVELYQAWDKGDEAAEYLALLEDLPAGGDPAVGHGSP